jgi:predicted nucleic acid-binding Zn ribbon protein
MSDSEQKYRFNPENSRRKAGTTTLGQAIEALLEQYKLKAKFEETSIEAQWQKLMGDVIASRTKRVYVSEGKLFLEIESPALRQELVLARNKIIEMINRELKREVVSEVVFL